MKTLYTLFFLVLLGNVFTPSVMAQDLDIPPVCITTLHADSGKVGEKIKTKVKEVIRKENCCASNDGDLLVSSNKLIKNVTGEPRVVDLPVLGKGLYYPQFANDGKQLTYWDFRAGPNAITLRSYDIVKEATTDFCTFYDSPYVLAGYIKNPNASIIVSRVEVSTMSYLHLYELKDNKYVEVKTAKYWGFENIKISNSGDRVFFRMQKPAEQLTEAYIEKTQAGWSQEIEVPYPTIKVDEKNLRLDTIGIANNGRTRLLKSGQNHFAVTHQVEGVWSEPEYVGMAEPRPFPYHEMKINNSEDGRVIVVEQPKVVSPDYGPLSWDIFVFLRDNKGQWSKHQINPPDVGALGDVLLSGNGQKLFWTPERSLSAVRSEDYK